MATQKKSTSTRGRTSTTKSSSRSTAKSKQAQQPKPIRREVGAVVCFVLAIFGAFGYFNVNALFIDLFCISLKGLVGYGFYFAPPALLLASYILITHRGRPVKTRVWCGLLAPVLLGVFFHMILFTSEFTFSFSSLLDLWNSGVTVSSGGALSGFVAQLLIVSISKAVSMVLIVIALVLMIATAFRVTISQVIAEIRDRPRMEYEYEEECEPAPTPRKVARERAPQPIPEQMRISPVSTKKTIDIPMDEEELIPQITPELPVRKSRFFERKVKKEEVEEVPVTTEPVKSAPFDIQLDSEVENLVEQGFVPVPPMAPVQSVFVPSMPVTETIAQTIHNPVSPAIEDEVTSPFMPLVTPSSVPLDVDRTVVAAPVQPDLGHVMESSPVMMDEMPKQVTAAEAQLAASELSMEIAIGASEVEAAPAYQYPPLSLLNDGGGRVSDTKGDMMGERDYLARTIQEYGIEAVVSDSTRGPSVTRYEVKLEQGVRLNKLTNLSDDIALALGVTGVRIAPIPGKPATVGIEVPNQERTTVYLHDVLSSDDFCDKKSKVSFAVGKDIGGECVIGDISKLPHMLIAGTTGSGKSVCTNSLIISLLYKATPDEVKFIMVDPKQVEFKPYTGIPHLLVPVITDPKKAAGSLQWATVEMDKRYRMLSEAGVGDLSGYNTWTEGQETMEKLPQIVIIIDELADLMAVAKKEVETSIQRLTAMGRACGMHLIVATQRPSTDVVTGVIKANLPSRIALSVASSIDSQVMINQTGAEKLMGNGDMFFIPHGVREPMRVQGCWVSKEEVAAVVDFVKSDRDTSYDQTIMSEIENHTAANENQGKGAMPAAGMGGNDEDYDDLLPDAIEVVMETGQASVSMLQRRLKLGYSRGARIVDQLEEKGIVGPFEGSKPRKLLITREQWHEMKMAKGNLMDAAASINMPINDAVPEEMDFEGDVCPQSREMPPFDMGDF